MNNTNFIIFFRFFVLPSLYFGKEYSIQTQNSSLGIYIEEIANLRISNTEWKLVMKIDLDYYREEFDTILDLYNDLKLRCLDIKWWGYEHTTKTSFCHSSLDQVSNMLNESLASDIDWFVSKRKKRALPLVLGGALLGGLAMGIMSKVQADEYYNNFAKLQAKHETYEMMFKKQTTLLKYVFTDINNMNSTFSNEVTWFKNGNK